MRGMTSVPRIMVHLSSGATHTRKVYVAIPSKYLLVASAASLAAGGLVLLFAPELLGSLVASTSNLGSLVSQVLGAAWLGLAALDWFSRGSMIGGVYGRPIVLANFGHFFITAASILKSGMRFGLPAEVWAIGGVAAVFALLFGLRLYSSPPEMSSTRTSAN